MLAVRSTRAKPESKTSFATRAAAWISLSYFPLALMSVVLNLLFAKV